MNRIIANILVTGLLVTSTVQAEIVSGIPEFQDCSAGGCDWSVKVDGNLVGNGSFMIDPVTGDISTSSPWVMDLGGGASVSLGGLFGNADPILAFSLSAGTGATGNTFEFNFNLPIALAGTINASSSVSYSLTSLTAAGAQISPLSGNVVVAEEVDTTPGGLLALNKGVDVGNTFFFSVGPATQASSVFTASNVFTGDLQYDLMRVNVAFALTPHSQAGISGFVQQVEAPAPVPLPAAFWLFGSGMAGLIGMAKRRQS